MSCVNYKLCALFLAATTLLANILSQAQLLDDYEEAGKPWPTYSLQNMPKTQFTCHDKILGGYYADPETQCQMFHVCVKLPGLGLIHRKVNSFAQQVQDYRFLCPNSTAFDQELQICANWADVDCDKAVLYYDNNNLNDLYRSNAADDSKANVNAAEEEGTFHLQRAESGDLRRSKQQRIEQKTRPAQTSNNYGKHNYALANSNADNYNTQAQTSKKPISSYYTPTTTTTTTSTTTTTERSNYYNHNNNNNDDSKQDFDDIFKGSHSSHFFANRHGGREYDDEQQQPKPNDFNDFNRKTKTTESAKAARVSPTRGHRTTFSTSTTTTSQPKSSKKPTQHSSFNADFLDYTSYYKSSTSSSTTSASSAGTTSRPGSSITSRFSFGLSDYQTQEKIQPTTYNPSHRFKTTSTPKYTELPRESTKVTGKNLQDFDKETTKRNKPTVAARKKKLGPQESNYINHNEFTDAPKIKLQQPQPFQAAQGIVKKTAQVEPQYQRSRAQQLSRVGSQEPAPFSAPAAPKQRSGTAAPASGSAASAKPRAYTSRGSITYKATTQRYVDDEFYYPTTTAGSVKKLSTHAAKDPFTPTTFKPTTYKKAYEQSFYQTQQTLRTTHSPSTKKAHSVSSTAGLPTTANPYYNIDEDDGQYHPELYENDFPRNRFKFLRERSSSTSTSTTSAPTSSRQPQGFNYNFQQAHSHLKTQQQSAYQKEREQSDLSDEDELFKTAQSLNFGAASINKLRADIYKAEKTSQQYNSQYSPNAAAATSSPKTFAPSSSSSSSTSTSTSQATSRPFSSSTYLTSTTTSSTTSTTRRPTTTTTTTSTTVPPKPSKSAKSKKEQQEKRGSKRPAHADEDTSYDYAYYDTD